MFILVTLLAYATGLAGYILSLFDKDKHPKTFITIAIIAALLFTFSFWFEKKQSNDVLRLSEQTNERLEASVDSVKTESRVKQDSLIALLEPFVEIAKLSYPGMPNTKALQQLAASVPDLLKGVNRLQPKLLRLPEKTSIFVNTETGLAHTRYLFRSQSGLLRDLRIEMTFAETLVDARYDFPSAGIVVSSGSLMEIDQDRKGFVFTTNELHPGNDLVIEVISVGRPQIVSERILP